MCPQLATMLNTTDTIISSCCCCRACGLYFFIYSCLLTSFIYNVSHLRYVTCTDKSIKQLPNSYHVFYQWSNTLQVRSFVNELTNVFILKLLFLLFKLFTEISMWWDVCGPVCLSRYVSIKKILFHHWDLLTSDRDFVWLVMFPSSMYGGRNTLELGRH